MAAVVATKFGGIILRGGRFPDPGGGPPDVVIALEVVGAVAVFIPSECRDPSDIF